MFDYKAVTAIANRGMKTSGKQMKKRFSKYRPARSAMYSVVAAAGILASESTSRATQTVSTWRNGVSGNWTTTSNWSSQPYFPGNGYPNASNTYAAVISAPGTYTVSLNYNTNTNSHAITIDSLLLNSAGATFNQSGSTLTSGLTNISAGTYLLTGGGTLTGGLLSVASTAMASVYDGTFSNMNLANGAVVNIAGTQYTPLLSITNGLQSAGTATLHFANAYGSIQFSGNEALNGIAITTPYSYETLNSSSGTLTLGSTSSISGDLGLGLFSLINLGSITANESSININGSQMTSSGSISAIKQSNLTIATTNWSNSVTISVDGNSTVSLAGSWKNTGTIQGVSGGTIILGGQFTAAGIGTLNPNGATLAIGGFNNTGNNFSCPTAGQILVTGSVTGGTITPPPFQALTLTNGGVLNGVQVAGDLWVVGNSTFAPGTVVSTGNINLDYNELTFSGTQTLDNANVQQSGGTFILAGTNASDVFTLGPHTSVSITPSFSGYNSLTAFLEGVGSIINSGSINLLSAQTYQYTEFPALYINCASFTNHGTISCQGSTGVTINTLATNDGNVSLGANSGLTLGGNWTNTGTMNLGAGSYVTLGGNWTNTGTMNLGTGSAFLLQGSFTTGSLAGLSAPGGTLTIDGAMDNSNANFVIDGSKGAVTINAYIGTGSFPDPGGSITGGSVEVGAGQTLYANGIISSATVTVDAGATLTGGGTISGPLFTNHGTLLRGTTINSDKFVNDGTINASGGFITVSSTLDVGQGILIAAGNIAAATLVLENDPSTLMVDLTAEGQAGLDVTGNVILGGNLDISSEIDAEIDGTFTYDVLTVDPGYSITGSFLNVPSGGRLEADDGSGSFEVDYGGSGAYANQIVLSDFQPGSVPEPAMGSLLGISLIGALCRRRRCSYPR